MWTLTAHDDVALRDISGAAHDAYIDGDVEFDRAAGVVVVPIAQEGWPDGPPAEREFVRETWRFREHRVTFFRGRLMVRQVLDLHELDDWDGPMIEAVTFQRASGEVHVHADDPLRATVEKVDVTLEISAEVSGHVRRRIGKLIGVESDVWLDQRRSGVHTRRLPL